MQKNEVLTLRINNLGINGEGVAIFENTPVFVPFVLPNELAKVLIVKVQKNFCYGKALEILEKSSDRVCAKCPVFTKCGGCALQHYEYNKQLEYKQNLVKNNLKKYANLDFEILPCVKSDFEYEYRNKLQLPIGEIIKNEEKKNVIGFYAINSNRIVETNSCDIHGKFATDLIEVFNNFIQKTNISCYNNLTKKGSLRHIVARYLNNHLLLTVVVNNDKLEHSETLVELLKTKFDKFSLYENINKKDNNVILGDKFNLLYGEPTIKLETLNIKHEISPQSFMQVNQNVQNKLYNKVLENIEDNSTVIDAYSGAGLMTAIVSQKAKFVYGIEIVEKAVENANYLVKENNIKNIKNICGDCSEILNNFDEKYLHSTSKCSEKSSEINTMQNLNVIIDPPRKGCDERVLNSIIKLCPNKIIYVSCNSATLSRDVKILLDSKLYKVKSIEPFDMFPQTSQVETLLVLEKEN